MASPSSALEPASGPHPLVGVFVSPGAAMDELVARPRFLVALLVMTAIGATMMGIALQRGAVEASIRQKMESDSRLDQLPAAQKERAMEQGAKFGSYMAGAMSVVGPTIGLLLSSGLFLLATNVLLGAQAKFRQMLAVVAHAWLPLSVHGLIAIPILLSVDPSQVDIQNVVPMSNLSLLFDASDQKKLYAVASSIDLFSLWVMALLAMGLSRLTKKSIGAVLPLILAPWALYVVVFKALLG